MKEAFTLILAGGIYAAYYFLPAQTRTVTATAERTHHFSQAGVAYATDYISLRLPSGVMGIAPGTQLAERLDVQVAGKEVVSNGVYTFALEPQMLTHDIELARQLAAEDAQDQGRMNASLARSRERRLADAHTADLLTAQDVDDVNATAVASSTVGTYGGALQQPAASVGTYAGGGIGGGGGYSYRGGTNITSVTINQFSGGGRSGSGGGGYSTGPMVSRYVPPRNGPTQATGGPASGTLNALGAGVGVGLGQ